MENEKFPVITRTVKCSYNANARERGETIEYTLNVVIDDVETANEQCAKNVAIIDQRNVREMPHGAFNALNGTTRTVKVSEIVQRRAVDPQTVVLRAWAKMSPEQRAAFIAENG